MPIGYEHCAKFCAAHPDQYTLAEHCMLWLCTAGPPSRLVSASLTA